MKNFILLISNTAESFLKKQLQNTQAIQIRLKKSGCSGYSYVLAYVEMHKANIIIRNIPFDILEEDMPFLNNTLIDIQSNGLNNKIVFENPHAINHCGCGESFSLGEKK